jgi:apolipoprotein N-acyltransferase
MAVVGGALLALAFPLTLALPDWAAPLSAMLNHGTPAIEPGYYIQLPWLAFIGLLPLLENARLARTPGQSALLAYITGVVWLLGHFSWIASFGWILVVLLAFFFSLSTALFGYLAHWLIHSGKPGLMLWTLPALWAGLEYLRSFGFWSFAWNALGYSQAHNLALIQAAAVGGVFAVSFLIVLVNCVLFLALTPGWPAKAQLGHAYFGAGVLLLALAGGEARLALDQPREPAHRLKLALIQGGVSSLEEWNDDFVNRVLRAYMPLSEAAVQEWRPVQQAWQREHRTQMGPLIPPQLLVVWPESTIPRAVDPRTPERLPSQLNMLVRQADNCALLAGAVGRPRDEKHAENGFILVRQDAPLRWAFSKVRLVPYGEVVPLGAIARVLDYPWGDYDISSGRSLEPFTFAGTKLGLAVCFDNFMGYVTREQVKRGAQLIILGTNNSWYDRKGGIRQHCDQDILRAVEAGRMLVRVSTTGWTQVVNPEGRLLASTNMDYSARLDTWADLRTGTTPYVLLGDLFAQVCLCLSLLICAGVIITGRSEGLL